MSRLATIVRYREKALDRAALVSALSFARFDEPTDLTELSDRQEAQLVDILHDFAFVSRKLIELAAREKMDCVNYAKRTGVFCGKEGTGDDSDVVMFSLVEVFGRIIHSDHLTIDRAHVPTPSGDLALGESAWAFRVASDLDKRGETNFVYTEFLLAEFLKFDEKLRSDIRWSELRESSPPSAT